MPKLALAFDVLANDKGATRTLDKVAAHSEKTGKRIGKSFAVLGGTIVGAFAGISAVRLFKDFNDEAREAQREGKLTAQVIKTTGKAAHVSQKQVEGLAEAISNKAGIDDKAVQSAERLLLTFTNVRNETGKGNKVFDEATRAAVDMSTALGTDLNGSAIQLGKALNDPIKGITALSRAGVSFTQQQKDQIKTFVKSGDILKAQKIILAEVGKEFGGAAEAAATPMDKLKVKIGNLEETIGTKLIPIEDKAATFLLDKGIPAIEGFVTGFQNGTGAGGDFADVMGNVGDGLETAWHVGKPFLKFIGDHPKLFTEIALGAGAFATAMKVMGTVKKLPGLGGLISKAAPLAVFVTNPGFGAPGAPRGGPVVAGPAGKTPLGKGGGPLLLAFPNVLTPPDLEGLQKQVFDIKAAVGKLTPEMFKAAQAAGLLQERAGAKQEPLDALKALAFYKKYGDLADKDTKKVVALLEAATGVAKTPVTPKLNDKTFRSHIDEGMVALRNLDETKPKPKVDVDTHGLLSGVQIAAARLHELDLKRPKPKVSLDSSDAERRAAHLSQQIGAIKDKHVQITAKASLVTSGNKVTLGTVQTAGNIIYVQGRGGKQLLAGGGWVLGPGSATSDSVPLMGSNGEFMMRERVAQKYPRQMEALNAGVPLEQVAASSGGTSIHIEQIVVPDNRTAMSVPEQLRAKLFTQGHL